MQDESRNAVQRDGHRHGGGRSGVERSRRAGEALDRIRGSRDEASARVPEIARASQRAEPQLDARRRGGAATRPAMVQQISERDQRAVRGLRREPAAATPKPRSSSAARCTAPPRSSARTDRFITTSIALDHRDDPARSSSNTESPRRGDRGLVRMPSAGSSRSHARRTSASPWCSALSTRCASTPAPCPSRPSRARPARSSSSSESRSALTPSRLARALRRHREA